MNNEIIRNISSDLKISDKQVITTLKLLSEGNTIPFIARYRKEMTNNLDEEKIRSISEVYEYEVNLLKRKEDVIRLINEKGLLTDELKQDIIKSTKLVEVEDLYRPFKEKKKTKATDAINNGLEPLAKEILLFKTVGNIDSLVKPYLNDKVKTIADAITGASYIISEQISDNALYRKWIRTNTYLYGKIVTNIKKNAEDSNKVYENYYAYEEAIKTIKPHRILAINRGENEKVLTVNIVINENKILEFLNIK